MALILALDASTDACSVALSIQGTIEARFEMANKSHTQRLLPMVDELLQHTNHILTDLDAVAFGRGPGSFTGLRICAGIVQGLAFGANLPVIPVSTLDALAAGYYRRVPAERRPLLVAVDARMNEIYWAAYKWGEPLPERISDEYVMAPELMLQDSLITAIKEPFVGVGSGWHYAQLQGLSPLKVELEAYPEAEDIARIAQPLLAAGLGVSAFEAQPVYLRDSVSWQKRQRIRPI